METLLKTKIRLAGSFLLITTLILPVARAQAGEGSSPFEPAPAGVRLSGIVECGRGYTSHELYDMKITLLEVKRGDEAWKQLWEASPLNKPADEGFEYILARIRFEYYARVKPGLCVHKLSPGQFIACSSDGDEYPFADVALPAPKMQADMKSGDTREGWIALLAPKSDKTPLLYYTADAGRAVVHGGNIWFRLY